MYQYRKNLFFLPFIYTELDRHRNFLEPVHETRKLIKNYNEHAQCKYENPFMPGGPRDSWLVERNRAKNATTLVTTYKTECVNAYFRPTVGNQCDCRQLYDGNKDGIIYARENYLVRYAFIMGILTNLQYQTCSVYSYVMGILELPGLHSITPVDSGSIHCFCQISKTQGWHRIISMHRVWNFWKTGDSMWWNSACIFHVSNKLNLLLYVLMIVSSR